MVKTNNKYSIPLSKSYDFNKAHLKQNDIICHQRLSKICNVCYNQAMKYIGSRSRYVILVSQSSMVGVTKPFMKNIFIITKL